MPSSCHRHASCHHSETYSSALAAAHHSCSSPQWPAWRDLAGEAFKSSPGSWATASRPWCSWPSTFLATLICLCGPRRHDLGDSRGCLLLGVGLLKRRLRSVSWSGSLQSPTSGSCLRRCMRHRVREQECGEWRDVWREMFELRAASFVWLAIGGRRLSTAPTGGPCSR
jgi:hypothetical protein